MAWLTSFLSGLAADLACMPVLDFSYMRKQFISELFLIITVQKCAVKGFSKNPFIFERGMI